MMQIKQPKTAPKVIDFQVALMDIYTPYGVLTKKTGVFTNSKGQRVYGGYFNKKGNYIARAHADVYSSRIRKVDSKAFSTHNLRFI